MKKFCNFQGIVREKRWSIEVGAFLNILFSEHEGL